jgi:Coenzyme PQQ synthesis protein D (PqqD)
MCPDERASRPRVDGEGGWSVTYRVNRPHVISETVGGETIIVNLASGHYFNLQGTAVEVWQELEQGKAVENVVLELEHRYEAGAGEIRASVEKLVDDFVAAELIVAEGNGAGAVASAPPEDVAERAPFVAPSFTTFTDMQDIILLDPVHEVDTRGWPHVPDDA